MCNGDRPRCTLDDAKSAVFADLEDGTGAFAKYLVKCLFVVGDTFIFNKCLYSTSKTTSVNAAHAVAMVGICCKYLLAETECYGNVLVLDVVAGVYILQEFKGRIARCFNQF